MKKVCVFSGLLFAAFFLSQTELFPQDGNGADENTYTETSAPEASETPPMTTGAVPDAIRRPQRGEAPRYPRDMIIGELGRGTAPEDAWLLAREFLKNLVQGSRDAAVLADSDSALVESSLEALEAINGVKFRIGGGKIEEDGSVSFLMRFIGRELSITGELYLRRGEAEPVEELLAEESAQGESDPVDTIRAEAIPTDTIRAEAIPADTIRAEAIPTDSVLPAEDGAWYIDDLLLEEPRDLSGQREAYRYDFSPYERFY
jgi:hypothetical protein